MSHTFDAEIREGRGGGAFVEVPFDVKAAFGSARPKVRVTFDGEPYRGSIASMGGVSLIGVLREIRSRLGKDVGDTVRVTVEPDDAPREVAVPDDLRSALRDGGLDDAFAALAYSQRREYVEAIEEAKKPETRRRRIEKALERLRSS
jgi:Domain of unknown function (DUF1905)/Bacteriocin-protection, YdeI or OmpD-Associated